MKTMPAAFAVMFLAGCAPGAPSIPAPKAAPPPALSSAEQTFDVHDFDSFAGEWDIENRRLAHRGVGSTEWKEFPAHSKTALFLGGVANVDQIDFPTLGFSGLTVRTFDLAKKRWSIYWVNSKLGVMLPPVTGGFVGDRGEFYGEDTDDGRPVHVRFVWTKLGPDKAHWEQSFDYGDGKWEKNWENTLTRRR
jgi:hypothetical protein